MKITLLQALSCQPPAGAIVQYLVNGLPMEYEPAGGLRSQACFTNQGSSISFRPLQHLQMDPDGGVWFTANDGAQHHFKATVLRLFPSWSAPQAPVGPSKADMFDWLLHQARKSEDQASDGQLVIVNDAGKKTLDLRLGGSREEVEQSILQSMKHP